MEKNEGYPQRRRTPSFSSTLLDAICRSIDESKSNLDEDPQMGLSSEITNPKQSISKQSNSISTQCGNIAEKSGNKERMNLRRAVMIEYWMEKQSSNSSHFTNSASCSSESTSGAAFSSSETESATLKSKPKQSRLKSEKKQQQQQQKPKRESGDGGGGGFARTKLRALKIYGELNQKVKQPISPGSRIASFLSSIFNTGNMKKAKMCYAGATEDVDFNRKSKSPCFSSSASSFSRRSCMSKTPTSSSSCSSSAKGKRSVRFYPVSVILGEDSQNDPSLLPIPSLRKMTRVSSIKEVKKNSARVKENCFVKGYKNSCKTNQFGFRGSYDHGEDDDDEEEEEDDDDDGDALSCSSSDLFELDHIIGAGRYQEELPVYETTNLEKNKAIANGLHL